LENSLAKSKENLWEFFVCERFETKQNGLLLMKQKQSKKESKQKIGECLKYSKKK